MANETYDLKIDTGEKEISHTRPLGTTGMKERVDNFIANGEIYPSENAYEMVRSAAERVAAELGFMESFTRKLVANGIVGRRDLLDLRKDLEDKTDHAAKTMPGRDFYIAFIGNQGLSEKVDDPKNLRTLPQMAAAHSVLQGIFEGEDQIGIGLAEKYAGLRRRLEDKFREKETHQTQPERPEIKYLSQTPEFVRAEATGDDSHYEQRDFIKFVDYKGGWIQVSRRLTQSSLEKTTSFYPFEPRQLLEIGEETQIGRGSRGEAEIKQINTAIFIDRNVGLNALGMSFQDRKPWPSESQTLHIKGINLGEHQSVEFERDFRSEDHPVGGHHITNYETYILRRPQGMQRVETQGRLARHTVVDQEEIKITKYIHTGKITAESRTRKSGIALDETGDTFYSDWSGLKTTEAIELPTDQAAKLLEVLQPTVEEALTTLRQNPEFRFVERPQMIKTGLANYEGVKFDQIPHQLEPGKVPFVAAEILSR